MGLHHASPFPASASINRIPGIPLFLYIFIISAVLNLHALCGTGEN
jgi:hypothetical protein